MGTLHALTNLMSFQQSQGFSFRANCQVIRVRTRRPVQYLPCCWSPPPTTRHKIYKPTGGKIAKSSEKWFVLWCFLGLRLPLPQGRTMKLGSPESEAVH